MGMAVALMAAGAAPARAQALAPPAGHAGAPPAAGGAPPSSAARPDSGRGATLTARYHVRQMENVLERAVQHAADMMQRRLQAVTPDVLAIAGTPRAQGFRIDGYGIFFCVEIPRLSESVNWALRVLSQDRDERVIVSLQKAVTSEQDPAVRADLERAIRTVQLQLSLAPRPVTAATAQRRAAVPAPQPPVDRTDAATVAGGTTSGAPEAQAVPQGTATLSTSVVPAPMPELAADAMIDPSAAYEDEVKHSLVDAMLDYAGSLQLPSSEWVTIAARDAGYVAFPDSVSDMVTVTLSVRASDLMDFRAQRLTRDQVRTRVVVKEF